MLVLEPVWDLHEVQLVAVTVSVTAGVTGVSGFLAGVTGTTACRRLLVGATTFLTQLVISTGEMAFIAGTSSVEVLRTAASPEAVPT